MIVFIARTMGSIGRRSGSSFVAVAALVADESEDDDEEVAASADDDGRGTSSSCRMLGEDIAMSPSIRSVPPIRVVVLDSTSRREAKRGQSTNRKGEMSRASH